MSGVGDADVLAARQSGGETCVQVFFFRAGRNFGNRAYFPIHAGDEAAAVVLEAFIGQFYQNRPPPRQVLIAPGIPNPDLVSEALSAHAGHRVEVLNPKRGDKRKLIDHAETNAGEALKRRFLNPPLSGGC